VCLKLIAQVYWEMGRKDFPGSELMIAQEPRMCPPQVSHSQCPESAPQMIPPSKSDEEPEKDAPCLPFNWVRGESLNSP
jgi:hypothetical protein